MSSSAHSILLEAAGTEGAVSRGQRNGVKQLPANSLSGCNTGRKLASRPLLGILGTPIPWGQVGQKEMGLLRANHTYSLKSLTASSFSAL